MTLPVAAWFGESLKSGSGILAAADYSGAGTHYPGPGNSAQFCAVTINSSGLAAIVTAQGTGQIKVLTNKPTTSDPCQLWDIGECKVVAGAAIAAGAVLMTDSSGRFITYVNNGANVPVGEARMPTLTGAGDIITAFIWPSSPTPGTLGVYTSAADLVAAGTNQATALQLTAQVNEVITGATTTGVNLPAAVGGGQLCVIINNIGNAIHVYGNGSDHVDTVAGATGVILGTTYTRAAFYSVIAGEWNSIGGSASA